MSRYCEEASGYLRHVSDGLTGNEAVKRQETMDRETRNGKCIVVAAGDLTVRLPEKERGDFVIAVDGGIRYCSQQGVEADLLLGDFDSVSREEAMTVEALERQTPKRVVRLPVEKDDTDMLAALKEGMRRGYRDFRIYGGTGGRLDHTLANIQCLLYLKKNGAAGYLVEEGGVIFVLMDETVEFREGRKGRLSLFSMTETSVGVTIRGMKYPLEKAVVRNDFPIGISNEFTGEKAVISVEKGQLACMARWVSG